MARSVASAFAPQLCATPPDIQGTFGRIWTTSHAPTAEFWFNARCKDLMSGDPPAWWKMMVPSVGLGAGDSWWPVCTMTLVNWELQNHRIWVLRRF
jgi:hypothetical protein